MPFIHIKSLPYEKPFNVPSVITGICRDFAEANHIPLEHVHTTWEFFEPGHFAKGDIAPRHQPGSPHSVLVDLLTPNFNSIESVKGMLNSIATSISKRANVPINKIFIKLRRAYSEMVFDDGEIVKW